MVERENGRRHRHGDYETRAQAEAAKNRLLDDYEQEHGAEARARLSDVLVILGPAAESDTSEADTPGDP